MKRPHNFSIRGTIAPITLGAAVIVAFLALITPALLLRDDTHVDMSLSPHEVFVVPHERFSVDVTVRSPLPVNVFSGEVRFDPTILEVQAIDYNTSIADLWAEKPWYENGAGTINFAGGTTRPGGFTGDGTLLTIQFTARAEGAGALAIKNARILKHDGLGTDAIVHPPLDTLITITSPQATSTTFFAQDTLGTAYQVRTNSHSPDLNNDGVVTFRDMSILLLNLASTDEHYDLNGDGSIDTEDLAVILALL